MLGAKQKGFSAVHALLAIVGVVALTAVAVPKYQDFLVRSKMSEAFAIVTDTKNKLTEFYIMKNRFPRTDKELENMETNMFSPPEFVESMVVEHDDQNHDVVVKVYLKDDVVDNIGGVVFAHPDVLCFVGGDNYSAGWSCGITMASSIARPACTIPPLSCSRPGRKPVVSSMKTTGTL